MPAILQRNAFLDVFDTKPNSKKMKATSFLTTVAVAALLLTACNNTPKHEESSAAESTAFTPSEKDKKFVEAATSGGMMEVELGKYAQETALSQDVKDFGAKMVADHSKANEELAALAQSKGITAPTSMTKHHSEMVEDMKQKKGADFDKAYVDMMVDDHKDDIKAFEEEAKDGQDDDLQAFAANTLPTLQEHKAIIKAIKEKMK